MNNVVMRKITAAAVYTPLVTSRRIASVTLSALPTNTGTVLFKGDDGLDVPWFPGNWHDFPSVNLADIQIKGNVGDAITIVGGTW